MGIICSSLLTVLGVGDGTFLNRRRQLDDMAQRRSWPFLMQGRCLICKGALGTGPHRVA